MGKKIIGLAYGMLALMEQRLPALTRLRQPESLPIILHRRRIYVLPTRFGILLGLMLCVMLLGALNYNNNPALLLTSLMGGAAFLSLFQGFRNLDGISVIAIHAEPCFAGEKLHVKWQFSANRRTRFALCLDNSSLSQVIDLSGNNENSGTTVTIELPTSHRGWQAMGRWQLWTDYPLGLFCAWSYLHPQQQLLVYPRLETTSHPLPYENRSTEQHFVPHSGNEFRELRGYRPMDPLRSIAWKTSARHDALYVKELDRPQGQERVFDWNELTGLNYEQRISRLARWVCDAEKAQVRYALRLPDTYLPAGHGAAHYHTCLQTLALLATT